MPNRKMPIGIQSFEKIRTENYVYVDKTALVYRMASEGNPFFLGRPRRFGKSLLLSTIEAYFLGQRELFTGLAIEELEKDWIPHPVLHIDLNPENYDSIRGLEAGLDGNLRSLEARWGRDTLDETLPARFLGLIRRAGEKSGRKVVVLIDEYDKPLLQSLEDPALNAEFRAILKSFYGVLKTADPCLRFVLLTGVTKFSQISVFSDLNQLRDISMVRDYADICGISTAELTANFDAELRSLADENNMSYDEALGEMQKRFNGYHFCEGGEGMFNPFSVLNTLASRAFDYYWFETGTPTFLIDQVRKNGFDLRELGEGILMDKRSLADYRPESGNPAPILYQSGYLTIKGGDRKTGVLRLGFPNEEVEYGFLQALLPYYRPHIKDSMGFYIGQFAGDLERGDVDAFMTRLRAFFADVPYELNEQTERHYQVLFYLVFKLLGQFVQAEVKSALGRADAVLTTGDTVYVFEFKLTGSGEKTEAAVEAALRQIDDKGYLIPYTATGLKLVKVGVAFNAVERNIGGWKTR